MDTASLHELTPVQALGGLAWKREDYFAPFGYGGINGGKLRQAYHLIGRAVARGAREVISAASVHSPQLSAAAAVSAFYGLPCTLIIGGKPQSAGRHENVRIAQHFGAQFIYAPVAYNPALQSYSRELAAKRPGSYVLPYGISVCEADGEEEIRAFHELGSQQVRNLPEGTDQLVVPTGSAHTTASILYGLCRWPEVAPGLRQVLLVAIGPDRMEYLEGRLALLCERLPLGSRKAGIRRVHWAPRHGALDVLVCDAVRTAPGFSYQRTEQAEFEGIRFHPRYEAKVVNYLFQHRRWVLGKDTVFWIIGSEPRLEAMA